MSVGTLESARHNFHGTTAFKKFDNDDNESISPQELLQVLIRLQEPATLLDWKAMIRMFDCNGDGLISFEDFVAMMNAFDASSKGNLNLA